MAPKGTKTFICAEEAAARKSVPNSEVQDKDPEDSDNLCTQHCCMNIRYGSLEVGHKMQVLHR